MEIGSFIELQLPQGMEFYRENSVNGMEVARLNSGRAAIYHALICINCKTIWIPYYQCESVKIFLERKGVECKFYNINESFEPINITQHKEEAVLIVNYYGIMGSKRMSKLASKFKNVIIDNSQAFFAPPIKDCQNVYSARKFVGVPDGAYVVGENSSKGMVNYAQGYSSDTSLFLLQRIEYGCEGKAYISRNKNEERIDNEDCKKMSKLTFTILDGTDYEWIQRKRKSNFLFADDQFKDINNLSVMDYYDNTCVPMVYPLLIEQDGLLERLLDAKHFQGHWWKWVQENSQANQFEKKLSMYMVPITIDQRYSQFELKYIKELCCK